MGPYNHDLLFMGFAWLVSDETKGWTRRVVLEVDGDRIELSGIANASILNWDKDEFKYIGDGVHYWILKPPLTECEMNSSAIWRGPSSIWDPLMKLFGVDPPKPQKAGEWALKKMKHG